MAESPDGELEIQVERSGSEVTVVFRGVLDDNGAAIMRERLRDLWQRGGDAVRADVSGVASVDLAGLAALMRLETRLQDVGSNLRLVRPSPAFLHLLAATGLGHRFVVEPAEPG
jgi:anti-anti-sigma factor